MDKIAPRASRIPVIIRAMFQLFPAHTPLRFGQLRTVVEGFWTSTLSLPHDLCLSLAEYLQEQPCETTGLVESHMRLPPTQRSLLNALCLSVAEQLQRWALLKQEDVGTMQDAALLMSMRGALPHHDSFVPNAEANLFWAISLQETDTDVLFGNLGQRIEQRCGTLLVFDAGQPHAVIAREHDVFMKSHFKKTRRQFFAGGDFKTSVWKDVGVEFALPKGDARRDVLKAMVHEKTGLLRK